LLLEGGGAAVGPGVVAAAVVEVVLAVATDGVVGEPLRGVAATARFGTVVVAGGRIEIAGGVLATSAEGSGADGGDVTTAALVATDVVDALWVGPVEPDTGDARDVPNHTAIAARMTPPATPASQTRRFGGSSDAIRSLELGPTEDARSPVGVASRRVGAASIVWMMFCRRATSSPLRRLDVGG
jgi:hypothetical protein